MRSRAKAEGEEAGLLQIPLLKPAAAFVTSLGWKSWMLLGDGEKIPSIAMKRMLCDRPASLCGQQTLF